MDVVGVECEIRSKKKKRNENIKYITLTLQCGLYSVVVRVLK